MPDVRIAAESLIIKRKVLEQFTDKNLYPYSKFYLRDIKKASGIYWKNHFSTIGIIGMNEACLNFMGQDIASAEGRGFALKVMDFLREAIAGLQAHLPKLMPLFCPSPNSYRRFVKGLAAPVNVSWGLDNRSVGLRGEYGHFDASRVRGDALAWLEARTQAI